MYKNVMSRCFPEGVKNIFSAKLFQFTAVSDEE